MLFASDRGGVPFAIYSVDVTTGRTRRLNGAGIGAQSPTVSPDGRELVFVGYTVEGFDLFSLQMDAATWTDVPPAATAVRAPVAVRGRRTAGGVSRIRRRRPYRPWRTLAPRYWTPIVESDNGEIAVGAGTRGSDALGRHAYGRRPHLVFVTRAARLVVRLRVRSLVADPLCQRLRRYRSVARRRGTDARGERRRGVSRPPRAVVAGRCSRRFSGSSDAFDCPSCQPAFDAVAKRRSVRFGWSFDNAKSYGYSISGETGDVAAGHVGDHAPRAWGPTGMRRR